MRCKIGDLTKHESTSSHVANRGMGRYPPGIFHLKSKNLYGCEKGNNYLFGQSLPYPFLTSPGFRTGLSPLLVDHHDYVRCGH